MTAYILDTETTGINQPHMTEVAYSIVELFHGKLSVVQAPRSKRYNPCKPIELGAMATSHICSEDIKDCPPHTDFKLPVSVEYLIGHNIDFDMTVLANAGVDRTPKLICTHALSRHLLPQLDSHKLVALLYHFHYDIARQFAKQAHAADYDVYFTQLILQSLVTTASKAGHIMRDISDVYELSEVARIPTTLPFGKFKGMAITDAVNDKEAKSWIKWLLKQKDVDPYLFDACQQALDSKSK